MQRRHYARGDIIIREGDPSDAVCRVIEGRVEVGVGQDPALLAAHARVELRRIVEVS